MHGAGREAYALRAGFVPGPIPGAPAAQIPTHRQEARIACTEQAGRPTRYGWASRAGADSRRTRGEQISTHRQEARLALHGAAREAYALRAGFAPGPIPGAPTAGRFRLTGRR